MEDSKVIPISDLEFDPHNPRQRTDRSSRVIRKSLESYGPLRSLVGQRLPDGRVVIRAGNGTLEEASQVGIEKVRLIERKSDELVVIVADDLDEEKWVQYSVDDNRSSDLSSWDPSVLEWLTEQNIDLSNSFQDGELDSLIESLSSWDDGADDAEEIDYSALEGQEKSDALVGGVRKGIQIEFNLDDYKEAYELIRYWRDQGDGYVGGMILDFLRAERKANE